MNILILGGTGFLGPHLVEQALDKGWTITTFNRGKTAPGLFAGERYKAVTQLRGDRDPAKGDGLKSLEAVVKSMQAEGRRFDAVIDNSSYVPRITRASAELLAPVTMMYLLVSTVSVWMDNSVAPDESTPVSTIGDPTVEKITGETYGPLKALCEQAAERACAGKACVVRPGLIVGPGDDSLRYTYWPVRLAEGGEVLAPRAAKPAEQLVQVIDVRDLAAFMLKLVADGHMGTYIATGPQQPVTLEALLGGMATALDSKATMTWADEGWLLEQQVAPWMGLPLWIPVSPETAGAGRASNAKAVAHGLRFRPLAETARDTLADFRKTAGERPADFAWGTGRAPGITRAREKELIAQWIARPKM
jgi:2'-hydroxyisoflavone reductase